MLLPPQTQKHSVKRQLLGLVIVFGALVMGYFICNKSIDKVIGNTCDIKVPDYETPLTSLFNHVKYYDYCSQYTMFISKLDSYGNVVWESAGYFSLTKSEYDEMKKYGNVIYYSNDHPNSPQFHSNY